MLIERIKIDQKRQKFTYQSRDPDAAIAKNQRNCQYTEKAQDYISADCHCHGSAEFIDCCQQTGNDHTAGEKRQGQILDRQPIMGQRIKYFRIIIRVDENGNKRFAQQQPRHSKHHGRHCPDHGILLQ